MRRVLEDNEYQFRPKDKKIIFSPRLKLNIQDILIITNNRTHEFVYNFGCEDFKGTFAENTLTVQASLSGMLFTDKLYIFVDDPFSEPEFISDIKQLLTDINDNLKIIKDGKIL